MIFITGIIGYVAQKYNNKSISINIYFVQLRHHQKNADIYFAHLIVRNVCIY